MRRIICTFVLLFSGLHALRAEEKFKRLRSLCIRAGTERAAANKLFSETSSVTVADSPVLVCFRGMALLLHAKYVRDLWLRYKSFMQGRKMLEAAIKRDPQNVEMRFYRYCVQIEAPLVLGYHAALDTDRSVLLANWRLVNDAELQHRIRKILKIGN